MWWATLATQLLYFAQPNPPDSTTLLHLARTTQAAFETFRIAHLPYTRSTTHWGRCDEIVGRFCFWHEEDPAWRPAPEAPAIAAARLRLLDTLDSLALLLPGNDWITGQQVRYAIEAGRKDEALRTARTCHATPWWCSALAGYALHAARQYASADSAFAVALHTMPAEARCRWNDLSPLLDRLAKQYRKLGCTERAALERRIWWLADPLYLVPGNERRTEHFARRVLDALQDQARSAYGVRWGDDLEELLLRYGWPIAWEREAPTGFSTERPAIISHNQPKSWQFLPPARFVENPATIRSGDWRLDAERPLSAYAPAYAASFEELPHQIAVFRRGDSIVVVAGYRMPDPPAAQDPPAGQDSPAGQNSPAGRNPASGHNPPAAGNPPPSQDLSSGPSPRTRESPPPRPPAAERREAALILARDDTLPPLVVRQAAAPREGVLAAIAPAESSLLSLETLEGTDSARAARARFWLPVSPLAEGIALSDPLLFVANRDDSLPASLADVLPLARGTNRVGRGERVGVFWETYGLEKYPGPLRITLTVTRRGRSWIRRAAEWAGIAARQERYVSLSWEEAAPPLPVAPRALVLSLADPTPGTYLLEIQAVAAGLPPARATRDLVVRRD